MFFTPASYNPPKWGARVGIVTREIPLFAQ